MKKILLFLFAFFVSYYSYSQNKTIIGPVGSKNTITKYYDGLMSDSSIYATFRNQTNFVPIRAGALNVNIADNLLYYYNGTAWVGFSGTSSAFGQVGTISEMQSYTGDLNSLYVTDTIRGGIFYYEVTNNDADNGVIFSAAVGKGSGKWRRLIDAAEQINPLWWGITLNDSTVDNAPLINSAIRCASKKGQAVTLNDSGYYGIMTTINVPKSATLTVGEKVNIVHYGADGVSMFTIGDSSSLIINGAAYLNRRIATGLYMEGAVNTYKTASTHIQFNIKGNNLIGQKGVELISDGGGVYGSAPVGYINDFNVIARDLDYFIYASATNQGNINNLRIKIEAGNCIHGIYLYSDTSKVPPNYTTGKTSLAYFNLEGNIRVGQATESMIYMDGAEESIIDLKIEDYGRYADTSLPTAAVYITSRSKQNSFRIKSFKTQFIHDEGVGNTFDVHSNTGGTLSQDLSPQNNSIYPNGTVTRFAGGLQSDYLFGSGSIYNAALGVGAKPGIIVSTNSNTTDSLYTMFMEEVDPASGNVAIYDANTTEKTIKIAIDHVIQGHTIGVEFGTAKFSPRYCKIEAWSDDDNVRYTLMETDTNWNGNSLMAVFAGKRLRTVTKCYQLGSLYNCKNALIGSYLSNVDTLYITVKGNNWKEEVDNIKINRIWLLVDGANPKNIITSVGLNGQNNTIYQPIKAYGDFDFYNSEIDMHNDTIRNAFLYGGMQNLGNIGDWDATGRFAGFYTFNAGNTAGTEPPSSTDIGTVIFSTISSTTPFWDGTQGATMLAVDNQGNTFTRGYSSGTGWTGWTNITAELALKLNISDTASMLSPYLRTNIGTAAFALKLSISDTSSMLSPYVRSNVANAALALKVNISDTSSMLSPYLRSNVATVTYAPITGSSNYIQNQYVSRQVASSKYDSSDITKLRFGGGSVYMNRFTATETYMRSSGSGTTTPTALDLARISFDFGYSGGSGSGKSPNITLYDTTGALIFTVNGRQIKQGSATTGSVIMDNSFIPNESSQVKYTAGVIYNSSGTDIFNFTGATNSLSQAIRLTNLAGNGVGIVAVDNDGDLSWSAGGGGGDMLLGTVQTVTAAKTFLDGTMKLRNVANTFDGYFVNTNTANRIYTLQDAAGTLAFLSDITGTNSGTNTGDQSLANTSDATSHTVTLTGGTSMQLIEGSNITLTTGGTGGVGTVTIASTGGSGEVNTASNLGGGLANYDSKSVADLRFNSFNATDFDLATNLISIDATLKSNWNAAATDALKWDGGATGLTASTGRTSLGGSTIGQNIFTSTNPSAITFGRANADNTFDWLSAGDFRTAIGAGTGSGTVTSVSGTAARISSTGGATPVIDIDATYIGQTSLTTLGTISTGTWQGGIVGSTYGGTGINNAGRTLTINTNSGVIDFTAAAKTLTVPLDASVSGTNTGDNSVNTLYSGLVTNATHTGDATGSTAITVVGINGTTLSALGTGILKNTTGTGVPSIAIAGDFPTLNQNTTGSAATLTTSRNIQGVAFNGSAAIDIINGTGFVKATGTTLSYDNSTYLTTNTAQNVSGAKTFLDGKLLMANVANTFGGTFTNTNTADRIYTLPDAAGTIALTSNITGTNSGTNTGDQSLANTSDATSHTVTLSGGTSVQLIEGSNITLTTGGTGGVGTVTIASTGGGGDMVLASAQTNSGVKTFLDGTMKLRNVANTFDGYFVNTNTANRIYTLPDRALTIDNITTATTTNGTGFIKGNGSVVSFDNSTYVPTATTVAGFALSGNVTLADLTATNSTLTFSGAYNGSTGRTVGLNLSTANTWLASQTITGVTPDLILGANTTDLGTIKFFGNTSGDVTLQPAAIAGTATVQTLPATTGTLVNRVTTANGVSASNSDGALSFTLGAITPTTVNGNTFTTGSSTYTGTAAQTYTFPTTTATIARTDAAQTFTGTQTFSQIVTTSNAITASANAATVPITSQITTVTNNSAATLTITVTTAGAVDGMEITVRIVDFSAATQTISWVNTENSGVATPTTSNGSTTRPLTVKLQYNSLTSKWRCIGYA